MASIITRNKLNGQKTFRVQIRRKNLPIFSITFSSLTEAIKWIEENEKKYIDDPIPYINWIKENRLKLKREREFK